MEQGIGPFKTHAMKIDQRSFGPEQCDIPWGCSIAKESGMDTYFAEVLNKPFNRKRFRRPGVFRFIGMCDNPDFSADLRIRCLDMPIKMPGSEYRLPAELKSWAPEVAMAAGYEHSHNRSVDDFYAYLTIDQKPVEAGSTQRKAGLHVDGYQGARISPKVACDRSYIVTSNTPPALYNQPFKVEDIDDSDHNIFHAFDGLAHPSSMIIPEPLQMIFMDCYTVHGVRQGAPGPRTFFRLTYSVRQFDRLGNSHNNCFDYEWEMVKRDVVSTLSPPPTSSKE